VSVSGEGSVLYLDSNANAVVNAENVTVYMKAGVDLAVFQPTTTVWLENEADMNDESGGPTEVHLCTDVVFDLSQAPADGCN
jgi:hypothetical protein